jgi:hypothetical protein
MGAGGFEPPYAGLSARSSQSSQGRGAPLRRPIITGGPEAALTGARWSTKLAYAPNLTASPGVFGGISFVVTAAVGAPEVPVTRPPPRKAYVQRHLLAVSCR